MDALGIEAALKYPEHDAGYRSISHFFAVKFSGKPQ